MSCPSEQESVISKEVSGDPAPSSSTISRCTYARTFWELRVYQKARELQRLVFEISRQFPAEEKFSLTDQIRRSSRSVGAQIAEAWGKRAYIKHFESKLTDAVGENLETQHWLITAVDAGYLPAQTARTHFSLSREIGAMLHSMSEKSDQFCTDPSSNTVKEVSSEFFFHPSELPTIFQELAGESAPA